MKTTIKLFCLVFALAFFSNLNGQAYKSAVGLRFGYPTSVSYKTFLNEKAALEAFVGYRGYVYSRAITLNAAYQIHTPIESVENLSWYYGFGAGLYLWSYDVGFVDDGSLGIALSGYLGLDYKIESLPLNLSVDWVPTFFVGGGYLTGFGGGFGALSARYVLNSNN